MGPIHGRQGALAEGPGLGDPTHAGHGQHVQDTAGRGKPDVNQETVCWCGKFKNLKTKNDP